MRQVSLGVSARVVELLRDDPGADWLLSLQCPGRDPTNPGNRCMQVIGITAADLRRSRRWPRAIAPSRQPR